MPAHCRPRKWQEFCSQPTTKCEDCVQHGFIQAPHWIEGTDAATVALFCNGAYGKNDSLDETKSSLIDHLRNSTLLLIVDDAEKLDDACLTLITEIAERTSTALVLVGTEALAQRVLHSPRLEWVRESLVEWRRLPDQLGDEEVEAILEKFFEQIVDRAVVRAAIDFSGKNLKRLCQILRIVRRSGVDGAVVSATMLQNAASQLLPRRTQVDPPAVLEKFKQPEPAPVLNKAVNAG